MNCHLSLHKTKLVRFVSGPWRVLSLSLSPFFFPSVVDSDTWTGRCSTVNFLITELAIQNGSEGIGGKIFIRGQCSVSTLLLLLRPARALPCSSSIADPLGAMSGGETVESISSPLPSYVLPSPPPTPHLSLWKPFSLMTCRVTSTSGERKNNKLTYLPQIMVPTFLSKPHPSR